MALARPISIAFITMIESCRLRLASSWIFAILLMSVHSPALAAESVSAGIAHLAQGQFAKQYVLLYETGKFNDAFAVLVNRRKAGDAWATETIGQLLFDSPAQMSRIAHEWAERTAAAGDPAIQFLLGYSMMHKALFGKRSGLNVPQAIKAVGWLDKAAAQGQQDAIFALSQLSRRQLEPQGVKSRFLGE